MKKLFFSLLLTLCLLSYSFAGETKPFPQQGLMTFQGLDDTSSPPIVKDGRAAEIRNVLLDITGQASKRKGYSVKNKILDINHPNENFEAVTGLWELYLSSGTRRLIATCGGRIFYDNSGVWADITSGAVTITEGKNNQFVWTTALDNAIGTNFVDAPIRWPGSGNATTASFTGLSNPITKAKCVIWWKNYLIWGNTVENSVNRTTRIRWSNVGTINTYSDDDFVDIATLGGQQIEAMATLYDDLYIFLTDSIYKISLVGGNELIAVTKVSEGIGCIAKNSVKTVGIGNSEGITFLSRDKTVNYFDGVKVTDISTLISNTMDDLSAVRLPYAVAIDDRSNLHYYLSATTGSASNNNIILDFHYGIGEWSTHTQIDANAFAVANDSNAVPQIYFGNYSSFVYQMQDPDIYSDVAGETGTISSVYGVSKMSTDTASGVLVLYNPSADFSDVTGAIVRITSGTGAGEESVIVYAGGPLCTTGIVVADSTMTATGSSVYSIGDIDAYYTTKWYDTGIAPLRKNFADLYVWSTTATSATMQVYYASDFISTITSVGLASSTSGSLWGTAIWGTDTWAGTETSLSKIPLNVSGRFLKLKFSEPTINEPMDLMGYSILFSELDYQ